MYYPRLPAAEVEQVRTENDAIAYQTAVLSSLLEAKQRALLTATVPTDDWIRADIKSRTERILDDIIAGEQLRYSIAGRFGRVLEPLIKPLGYDWKMGVGLIGAFAAREVFVSTMGIVYSVGDDDQNTEPLSAQMQSDRYPDGRPVWTPLVAVSLLVWFVLAMQCMSTLAIVRRETGGWRWPIAMLLYMNALAYVVSLAVYQVGRIWL
jgi:ferrous iron transport protein B